MKATTLVASAPRSGARRSSSGNSSKERGRREDPSSKYAEFFEFVGELEFDPTKLSSDVRERLCMLCGLEPDGLTVDSSRLSEYGITGNFRRFHLDRRYATHEMPQGSGVRTYCHRLKQSCTTETAVGVLGGSTKVKATFADLLAYQFGVGDKPKPAVKLMPPHGRRTLLVCSSSSRVVQLVRVSDERLHFDSKELNGDLCPVGTHVLSRSPQPTISS